MTFDEFVNHMRQEIREEGFLSAMQLVSRMTVREKECGVFFDCLDVLKEMPCDDIKVVEFANSITAAYRRKDLYYFSPVDPPKENYM